MVKKKKENPRQQQSCGKRVGGGGAGTKGVKAGFYTLAGICGETTEFIERDKYKSYWYFYGL